MTKKIMTKKGTKQTPSYFHRDHCRFHYKELNITSNHNRTPQNLLKENRLVICVNYGSMVTQDL